MKRNNAITLEQVKRYLTYTPTTGQFVWKPREGDKRWNTLFSGKPAGYHNRGYLRITIDGRAHFAHRLAYMLMTGSHVPQGMMVDHADTCPGNNRWSNLRLCSYADNCRNSKRQKNNKTGFKGVYFDKQTARFRAMYAVASKNHHLGRFDTAEEAAQAYRAAALKHYGEYARFE